MAVACDTIFVTSLAAEYTRTSLALGKTRPGSTGGAVFLLSGENKSRVDGVLADVVLLWRSTNLGVGVVYISNGSHRLGVEVRGRASRWAAFARYRHGTGADAKHAPPVRLALSLLVAICGGSSLNSMV